MSELRKSVVQEFCRALDDTHFTIDDFAIETYDTAKKDGEPLIRVTFRHYEDYTFELYGEGPFYAHFGPGSLFMTEVAEVHRIPESFGLIEVWCNNILSEIRSHNLVYRDLDELRQILQSQISEHLNDTGSHFTPEEKDRLKETLDEMRKEIDYLIETNKGNEEEINKIKEQLSQMEDDLETFPKDIWYRTAANKLLRIFGSREVLQIAATTAKALLPGGGGEGANDG